MADKEKSDDKGYSTGVATASPPKTVEKEPLAGGTQGSYSATTVSVPPADMLTEQEKDAAAGGEGAGVGPVSASETTTGPVETIEDQDHGRADHDEQRQPAERAVVQHRVNVDRASHTPPSAQPSRRPDLRRR